MPTEAASSVNIIGVLFSACMGICLLVLPRKKAFIPIVLITCYMTFGQKIVFAGLNFTMLRLLVLFGCARVAMRGEFRSLRWTRMDTVLLLWTLSGIITYTLLWQTTEALVNRLGVAYDAVGLYFLFRCLVRDTEDIERACKVFAVVLCPLALSMCIEKMSGQNPFFAFGGVPQYTMIRDGVLRCQGPFQHPILAGTFGAVWVPFFIGLWWRDRRNRLLAVLGLVASALITLTSGSSGPIGTYAAGIMACCMWQIRGYMRAVRWGIVLSIVALQLVMKDPVWFIFARINILSASTGWHRSNLIDRTIAHFFDWWLVGAKETISWGVWWGDITNEFILQGVRGGITTMLLFTYIVVLAFSGVGKALKAAKNEPKRNRLFLWALGCTLFVHVVSFMNVAYFDQNVVNFYLALGMTAAVMTQYLGKKSVASAAEVRSAPESLSSSEKGPRIGSGVVLDDLDGSVAVQ